MKKTVTVVLIFVIILWSGVYKLARYKIDMYYSNLAPQQLNDDSAYTAMQTRDTFDTLALVVYLAVTVLCLYLIFRTWTKQKQAATNKS